MRMAWPFHPQHHLKVVLRAREEDVPGRTTGRGVLSHGSKFGLNEHYPQGSTSNKNTALARRKVHQHVALLICTLHLRWDSLTPYIVIYDSRIKATLGFNVSISSRQRCTTSLQQKGWMLQGSKKWMSHRLVESLLSVFLTTSL